ncbi:MAG: hypothetical protein E7560_05645 [Ruminococcaceae bacterium]|nr:hypothetical protein [Oscillospiraceae bacterium]
MKNCKKLLSVMLAIVMLLAVVPLGAFSAVAEGSAAQIGETTYETFDAACNAAVSGDTIKLIANAELTESVTISGKTVTLDLGEYTITDKSTTVLKNNSNVWGLIELKNGANLTVTGNGTIECNYTNVTATTWKGMAYAINVDSSSKLTVESGTFINGNGGIQTQGEVTVNGGTFVSHNGGCCIFASYTGKVTVNDGTFKDYIDESDVYTGSGAVWSGFGATVEIKGGTYDFAADPEHGNVVWTLFPAQHVIAGQKNFDINMTVSGGTFHNFNPATDVVVDYSPSAGFTLGSVVEEGFAAFEIVDGVYSVKELPVLPDAEVKDIKSELTNNEPDLTFALNFSIKDLDTFTEEYINELMEAYGDHYVDYVLTIDGLSQESVTFNADGSADGYLAGQYDSWNESWLSVPFDDVTVNNGDSLYIMSYAAQLMNKQGLRFTLAEVAEYVVSFNCGIYFTPEFLAANPNLDVNLELKIFTEDENGNVILTKQLAENNFDTEDVVAIVSGRNKQSVYYSTLGTALQAAVAGDTVTLIRDVTEGYVLVTPGVTLDLNGKKLTANYLVGFNGSNVVDNGVGADGELSVEGRLIIAKDNVVLDKANAQTPIYDAENGCYVFITVDLGTRENPRYKFNIADWSYSFSPKFGVTHEIRTKANPLLLTGYDNHGVKVVVRVTWIKEGEYEGHQDFAFLDAKTTFVVGSYGDKSPTGYANMFKVYFDADDITDSASVAISTVIISDTGAEFESSKIIVENGEIK